SRSRRAASRAGSGGGRVTVTWTRARSISFVMYMARRPTHQSFRWARRVAGRCGVLTTFTDGRVIWPAISANGKSIVFERNFGIWRYDVATHKAVAVSITLRGSPAAAGTEHRTFTNGIQRFALSPDGRKVAFIVHGEIFAASSKDGGDAIRVTNTPAAEDQLEWAPDSKRLVYTSDRDGPRHIFSYDFTTNRETQLTRGGSSDVSPEWSPDGAHIVYTRDA